MKIGNDRKIEVNKRLVKARWFYISAILFVGLLNNFVSKSFGINLNLFVIVFVSFLVYLINYVFYIFIQELRVTESERGINGLSIMQIIFEFIIISAIVNSVGGQGSIIIVLYILPLISSSMLFGTKGSITTALLSGLLIKFNVFPLVSDVYRFKIELFNNSILNVSIFYMIIGIFSGFLSNVSLVREELLRDRTEKLLKEKEYRKNEWMQLDKTAKLLVKRDNELTKINDELDMRINDLKRSEKSMLKAFSDLKIERKKTEEERNKTVAILSHFIDPVIVIDREDRINFFNPACREVLGFSDNILNEKISSDEHYSMKNFSKIVTPEYKVKTSNEMKSNNPLEEEIIIKDDDKENTYKVTTAEVASKEGKNLGVMKIFYNLTREKMIDKLKSEFISIAAHQLRTPLSAIKWVIKMVLDGDAGKLNDEQIELLNKGYKSNERIIELVNDMLNVSRIEEGRFGYSFESNDYLKELDNVIETLEARIKQKNIKFILNKPEKMAEIYMDKQRMVLVLQNLIENAVKYTPEYGKIEVTVENGDKFITTKVKDDGVGIPEADKEKLFSKFFRASNVIRMQTEGTGLGLFITRNIIQKHGGDIICNSKEGSGTEFVFTLPLNNNINNLTT